MNPTFNEILERIHKVLGNLVQPYHTKGAYIDKDDPWLDILAVTEFEILSTTNRLKGYSLVELIFGCNMILPIKYTADC